MNAPRVTMHKRKNCAAAVSVGRFHRTKAPTENSITSRMNHKIEGTKSCRGNLPRTHQHSNETSEPGFLKATRTAVASDPSTVTFLAQAGRGASSANSG